MPRAPAFHNSDDLSPSRRRRTKGPSKVPLEPPRFSARITITVEASDRSHGPGVRTSVAHGLGPTTPPPVAQPAAFVFAAGQAVPTPNLLSDEPGRGCLPSGEPS